MDKLFWGLLFTFLDFNLDLGNVRIGLIPDFLGYIFIVQGCGLLREESERFAKVKPVAVVLAVYSGVSYITDLFGISVQLGAWGLVLGLVFVAVALYMSFQTVAGVQDMEAARGTDLRAAYLRSVWTAVAVLEVIVLLFSWVPVLNLFCLIAAFVVYICFLAAFHRSRKLYNALAQ